ncbi:MAG: 50S ribosomal protein L28 [Chloroflexota bacterium]
MASCTVCGKTTTFGRSRPWSRKSTNRKFKTNLQKVSVYEGNRKVQKLMCTRCQRTLSKVRA